MWSVKDVFGKSFFVAGLMPALAFLAACDYIILPQYWGGKHLIHYNYLGLPGIAYIVGGIFLGFLLLSLNTPIIKLYENGLLISRWLRRRNERRHKEEYTALIARREAYRLAVQENQLVEESLAKLEAVYEKLEALHKTPELPYQPTHIMPTRLGNAFAVMEEYPYDRYGMDAMVYWPRLTIVIPDHYKNQLTDLKTTLDFLLNLSLLAWIFGIGAIETGLWARTFPALITGSLAVLAAYGLYRIAIHPVRDMGVITMSCFDLFRKALLQQYGLPQPGTLNEERQCWRLLASFIRRGEDLYFPCIHPQPPTI